MKALVVNALGGGFGLENPAAAVHAFLQPADHVGWLRRIPESEELRGALRLT